MVLKYSPLAGQQHFRDFPAWRSERQSRPCTFQSRGDKSRPSAWCLRNPFEAFSELKADGYVKHFSPVQYTLCAYLDRNPKPAGYTLSVNPLYPPLYVIWIETRRKQPDRYDATGPRNATAVGAGPDEPGPRNATAVGAEPNERGVRLRATVG